jgi:plasmid stabilization system protein ParE
VSLGYRLTSEAQPNVDDICAFIAEDNVDAAVRLLEALEHAFEQLADTPEIGLRREVLTTRTVKFWAVYSYLVVYARGHAAHDHCRAPRRARCRAVAEGEGTVMRATAARSRRPGAETLDRNLTNCARKDRLPAKTAEPFARIS